MSLVKMMIAVKKLNSNLKYAKKQVYRIKLKSYLCKNFSHLK
ncbi:Uncharacterised protein [Chryseobacterium taihuense]|uniref:Uncharacterized protein n=1 Tax=Chryseobacterium taihuense TaxID=1141221 RepID=A0A4V6IDM8_9FLAO|nr:Uncharacterised protein [Chryseobacterium taihuense]